MKKTLAIIAGTAALGLLAAAPNAFAKAKGVTLSGEAECAKCTLHEKDAKSCQTVIVVKHGKKTVEYYVADNEVGKAFHKNVCHGPEKVKATGAVKTVEGRRQITLSKIEEVK